MTEKQETNHAFARSRSNAGLGLAEFAKLVSGCEVKPYQKEMLDALERGEKMRYDPCTGRRYYKYLYTQWREYLKRIDVPNE